MSFPLPLYVLPLAFLLAACAAPRPGVEDTWGRRAADFVDPIVPDGLRIGPQEPALKPAVRIDPADFTLADRRQVRLIFSVQNTTRRARQLEFPTTQRLEAVVLAPDGQRIFLWSEDRLFESRPSSVVINPGERLEYEATVPTRDMVAGLIYSAEVGLVGYPEVAATVTIAPR